jgi:RNase P subunit RPR2
MNTSMLTRVRQLFNVSYVPRSTNRHNQKQYIKSIRYLGNKWLIHQDNRKEKLQ